MSFSDIKDHISRLSSSEQDDVMALILSLRYGNEEGLSDEWTKEIEERKTSYQKGEMTMRPLSDFLDELN